MPTIERRLETLEAKLMLEPKRNTTWIHFVDPGELGRPVRRIWLDAQEWHRRDGEPDEAFRLRAESEAALLLGHTGLLMQMD